MRIIQLLWVRDGKCMRFQSAGTGVNICPFVLGLRGDFCDGLKRPEVEMESSWTILFDFCLRTINKEVC